MNNFFDNAAILDLNSSLNKEYLLTDGTGGYCASTICGCNTRKYHGLLVAPQPKLGNENHVLLSSLDEVITYKNHGYSLGMHQYPGTFHPHGYTNVANFNLVPVPSWQYQAGDAVITKELLLLSDSGILIRYTVLEASDVIALNLHPFLAFRNVDSLSKANLYVNKKISKVANGIQLKMYDGYRDLFMQLSVPAEFITVPDWHYNIEYVREQERGYESSEDLYVPGHFTVSLKKGDQFIFCAGFEETNMKTIKSRFTNILKKKSIPNTLTECLENAAEQFIITNDKDVEIKAGYHWFGRWGRDTFISLPGITLATGKPKVFEAVINTMLPQMKDGVFPNAGYGDHAMYNTVDASLWFIWALQQYTAHAKSKTNIWKEYGPAIKSVLDNYRNGTYNNIKMDEDGLIYAGVSGKSLTWMDAIIDSGPVTPRIGKPVEINALWYNAICFALIQARLNNDKEFIDGWEMLPARIKESFVAQFWNDEKGYLADFIAGDYTNWSIRPNQIFAVSLPFSPLPAKVKKSVADMVKAHLLTPMGLRTMSPDDPEYIGIYGGDQPTRDRAYHQGTVWPWLAGHFAEAWLNVYGEEAIPFIEYLYESFTPALEGPCLNSISEVFDGDLPQNAGGTVSQAWNIAELLRINQLMTNYTKTISKTIVGDEQ